MDFLPDVVDTRFLVVQGLGVVGFIFQIASFQILSPRKTIAVQAASQPFFMLHFLGLGHEFLAVFGLLALFRDLSSGFISNTRIHKIVMIINLCVMYSLAFFFARSPGDFMGLAGSTASSISQFFRSNFYIYRSIMLFHNVLWLATNIYAGSWAGSVVMVGISVSNIIGIIRYKRQDPDGSGIDLV